MFVGRFELFELRRCAFICLIEDVPTGLSGTDASEYIIRHGYAIGDMGVTRIDDLQE